MRYLGLPFDPFKQFSQHCPVFDSLGCALRPIPMSASQVQGMMKSLLTSKAALRDMHLQEGRISHSDPSSRAIHRYPSASTW